MRLSHMRKAFWTFWAISARVGANVKFFHVGSRACEFRAELAFMNDERNISERTSSVNLTLSQAAEELEVSLATARRLVRAGKLRAVKIRKDDRSRWEVPPEAIDEFKLNPDGERASSHRSERDSTGSERNSNGANTETSVHPALIEAHLEALKLVSTLQEKFEAAQRRAEQAERALMPLSEQLSQYQRCLSENAESLAEERSRRLEAEFKILEATSKASSLEVELELPEVEPVVNTPQRRRGWGQRLKVWLLGEKTG